MPVGAGSMGARVLFGWERMASRAADLMPLGARAQAESFDGQYGQPAGRIEAIPLGVESAVLAPLPPSAFRRQAMETARTRAHGPGRVDGLPQPQSEQVAIARQLVGLLPDRIGQPTAHGVRR